jgi:hypothetical protein
MFPSALFSIFAALGLSAVVVAARMPDKIYGVNIGSWCVQFFDICQFDV